MIKRLLIANRGEIVTRIIRTCKEMGIATVAVYSEADREAPYLDMVDEAVHIGPSNPLHSYLSIEALIDAARKSGSDAVHPGYGFLSERAVFAQAVVNAGLVWVGPAPEVMKSISSKCYCRHLAAGVGVPFIPGTLDPVNDPRDVAAYGREHGYPLFLKLDKGGGGKGIEMVSSEGQVEQIFQRTCSIGNMAFGSGACYIEKVIDSPRHIEIQFVADNYGNCVLLGERECSIQRRHQKIIEEAPSVVVTEQERELLFDYSRRLVRRMNYHGAGTLEGLRSADGRYYFMEVNARLQVEHGVSELLTGIDIVKCQIQTASGEALGFRQEDIGLRGHAIEARVYAEDPETFLPSPGRISGLQLPETGRDLRVDHALENNYSVPPYYDPLLAKVISWGEDRTRARERLISGLEQFVIVGVKSTISANLRILRHPNFASGDFSTAFMSECFNNTGSHFGKEGPR
ncbi:MAG: biotin carboxylase N-terminal domain-containing protein [Desulfomonilaceae bacterium]|nr:biotin carboxylase N-terminal domain-containing protein [Desulfomonilaceae bacterium]